MDIRIAIHPLSHRERERDEMVSCIKHDGFPNLDDRPHMFATKVADPIATARNAKEVLCFPEMTNIHIWLVVLVIFGDTEAKVITVLA